MAAKTVQAPRKVRTKAERIALMDQEMLDVEGAATVLGGSATTVYHLARKGEIPATRVGRAWRFSRSNLVQWVVNGTQGDQRSALLRHGRGAKKRCIPSTMA
jgi:excisionase family DNA binding protein